MIINGSPRAPRSNSQKYAKIFQAKSPMPTEYFTITKNNHLELCKKMNDFTHVLLVFPLYADSIPVTLLNFLKTLEINSPSQKPKFCIMINCGFIEPNQNDIAVKMIQFFCQSQGYSFGSVLRIGSGEAILTTPFQKLVEWKIKKFSLAITKEKNVSLKVTMPLPKKVFVKASTKYWENYEKKNGITKEQMSIMDIEN